MTRSVEELRRESERSRAELSVTVDQLRARISDTAEDIRHKVSPQHIKSEVSDYISHKTQSWVEALKQQAMENPMQAIAAGTAVAVPVLRLARGSSLPLLMIGAARIPTAATMMWRMPLPARRRSSNSADTTPACAGCRATTTTTTMLPGSASVFKPTSTAGGASDYDGVLRALSH